MSVEEDQPATAITEEPQLQNCVQARTEATLCSLLRGDHQQNNPLGRARGEADESIDQASKKGPRKKPLYSRDSTMINQIDGHHCTCS